MKAALYIRGSKEEIDLRNQHDPLFKLAEARGWEIVEYVEVETGDDERARRPVLERLLKDARRGEVRQIAVVALDRLTRRTKVLVSLFDDFEKWKVGVVSLNEGDKWTEMDAPFRRIVLTAMGTAAEMEMLNLRKRVHKGLDRARRHGTKSGKPIGRPRANQLLLGAAARHRQEGKSLRQAARLAGVKLSTLRRYMARLKAAEASRNDEGGPAGTSGAA